MSETETLMFEKGIARIHVEIAALGQQVAGLTTAVSGLRTRPDT